MKKQLFIALLLFSFTVSAQPGKEAWHWYFGNKSKIDFNTGVPVTGTSLFTFFVSEGCASVSDPNTGQYLFSSQASYVTNSNLVNMPNGTNLFGYPNSTQGSLIVPKPGSSTIYYVFTNDFLYGTHGTHYSVVDVSLGGGLGAVTLKNQVLTPAPVTEKLVAGRHCNGKDYWVINMHRGTNTFNAYLITAAGVSTTPVISNSGAVLTYYSSSVNEWPGCGYMKISPNGKKLALGSNSDSLPILELFDFDNITGIVSNPIIISYPGISGPYGLTFSPDNSKLYATPHKDSTSWLYQYDLSSGVASTIIASQTLIAITHGNNATAYTGDLAAMQIAPDGKIYIARYHSDSLSVINNPNTLGSGCNFQSAGLTLPSAGYSTCGLPNFIDANYAGININIPDIQLCNTFPNQTLDAGPGFTNYFWSTGASTQTISVNSPGKYWVTVTNDQGCTKTDTVNAYLLKPLREDTLFCGPTYIANVAQGGVLAYNWFDGNTNPVRNFTQSGNYYVDINFVTGCAVRDSIFLKVFPSASVNIGPDTTFCLSNFNLNAQNPKGKYLWSTGETSQSINATKAGTYWVVVTDSNGCEATDTLIVRPQLSAFNFQMPNIVTPNDDKINDVIDFGIYQFSSLQIEIYNRWGQKVFESNDAKGIWKPVVDDGTYFYTAQYKIDCGMDSQTKNLKGFITVVR